MLRGPTLLRQPYHGGSSGEKNIVALTEKALKGGTKKSQTQTQKEKKDLEQPTPNSRKGNKKINTTTKKGREKREKDEEK